MGNYRFRLSDMIPNAWFYKLRDMSRTRRSTSSIPEPLRKTHPSTIPKTFRPQLPPVESGRASYYIPSSEDKFPSTPVNPKASDTKFLIDPPRKSKKKPRGRSNTFKPSTKIVTSSISSACSCRTTLGSVLKVDYPFVPDIIKDYNEEISDDFDGLDFSDKPVISATLSRSCNNCRVTSSATDIIINMDSRSSLPPKLEIFSEDFDLPPVLTKPAKQESDSSPEPEQRISFNRRRSSAAAAGTQGLRLRANTPKLRACKKMQTHHRSRKSATMTAPKRGLSESFLVVKLSSDPIRDFRDSMMEMIVENNIRAAKDLEELLACYLSLNSDEYHDVIVKVFEEIWFDLTSIQV